MRGLAVLAVWALTASAAHADAPRPAAPRRVLVVALDAVPYSLVARLTHPREGDAALFSGLDGPAPLVSTFPSTTSLAFTGLFAPLDLAPAPGYEPRFFDRGRNRRRGGGPWSYGRIRFPWKDRFDWRRRGVVGKLVQGAAPMRAAQREIDGALQAFAASDSPLFLVFVDATDLVAHLKGPAALARPLAHLDRRLRELRRSLPPFSTVLLSDHGLDGGEPLRNARRSVRRALRRDGYRLARRLGGPRDVVLVPYGLVSSLVVFASPGEEKRIATILAATPSLELCALREGAGYRVVGAGGSLRFEAESRDGQGGWRVRVEGSDPLTITAARDHAPVEGWRSAAGWRRAAEATPFPDPFPRIAAGFALVANPASVICSTAPGWLYGGALTHGLSLATVGRLRFTHGSLRREASLGFLMTDLASLATERPLRFDEALLALARERAVPAPATLLPPGGCANLP